MREAKTEDRKGYINVIAVFIAFIMGLTFGRVDVDSILKSYVERTSASAVSRENTTKLQEISTAESKTGTSGKTTVVQTEVKTEMLEEENTYEQTNAQNEEPVHTYADAVQEDNTEVETAVAENTTGKATESESIATEKVTETTQANTNLQVENGEVLYRTPTGKKFHVKPGCAGERRIETTYDEAVSLGLTPCGVCAKAYG